ncbi:MAG: hypothetical protein ABIL16_03820 [candidate division WOR-3 bacterium]
MEVEAKFILSSDKDFERVLGILRHMGLKAKGKRELSFWDVYLKTDKPDEAIRYRVFGDRIVRTYKKDVEKSGVLVKRVEREKEVSEKEFNEEKTTRGVLLETYTKRVEYDYGDFKLTFDSVVFEGHTNMLFAEVEGDEEAIKMVVEVLVSQGFKTESRSKLRIGLEIKGDKA